MTKEAKVELLLRPLELRLLRLLLFLILTRGWLSNLTPSTSWPTSEVAGLVLDAIEDFGGGDGGS